MDVSATADNETVRPMKRQRTVAGVDTADAPTNDEDHSKLTYHVNGNNNQLTNTTLPPECWAGIMNYLDYDSVLSCAATSKMILHDAMPLVTSLHIDRSSQLNGLNVRFRDVQVLNVLSLVHVREGSTNNMKVDGNTVMSIVPFLLHFKKLKRVFLGGRDRDGDIVGFHEHNCLYSNKDEQLIGNLMDQISNAFQRHFLPTDMLVLGLRCPKSNIQGTSSCQHCQLACKTWPIQHTINFENKGSSKRIKETFGCRKPNCLDVCLTHSQIENLIDARPGGNDLLRSDSRLMYQLSQGSLFEILSDDGTPFRIVIFYQEDVEEMKRIIDHTKLDVKQLNREDVMNAMMKSFTKNGHGRIPPKSRCYEAEYTFNEFTSLGLPVHEEDWNDHLKIATQNLPQIIKALKSSSNGIVQSKCLYLFSQSLRKEQGFSIIQPSIDLGVMPLLTQFLKPNYSIRVVIDSACALGRIARSSTTWRDVILKSDIIAALGTLLEHGKVEVHESASWLMRVLCKGHPKPDFSLIKSCVKPLSSLLLNSDSDRVLVNSSIALFKLSQSKEGAKAVVESGVYPRLVQLLGHSSKKVQTSVLMTISKLSSVDKSLIEPLMNSESFSTLIASASEVDSQSVDVWHNAALSAILYDLCKGRDHIRTAVSQAGCLQFFSNMLSLNAFGTDTQSSSTELNRMIEFSLGGLLMILEFGRTEEDESILDVVGTEMQMIETRLDDLEKIVKGGGNIDLLPFINELLKEIDKHKSHPKPRRSQRLRKRTVD